MSEKIATPIIQPRIYFFKDSKPLVGGKVYAFKIGENEFKPTFRNAELTALNQNPIVLDQAGSCLIYMKGAVRLQVFDKNDVFIEERVVYQQRQIAQFFDKYGKALSFGKVQTLDYQSTIKKASYKNGNLNQNPVLLDENGCAEISIAGAYRLRSYNKSGLFVADQDFKRLPARALTSRPYPAYFNESIVADVSILNSNQRVAMNKAEQQESIFTSFTISSASTREAISDFSIKAELIGVGFTIASATIEIYNPFVSIAIPADSTRAFFKVINASRNNTLVRNTMRQEAVNVSFSIANAQITN